MIQSTLLSRVPVLRHGLSTRVDGSVSPPTDSAARAARAACVRSLGGDPERLVTSRQVHGTRVALVAGGADEPGDADGLATNDLGRTLLVKGADCPLILLVDPDAPALVVAHSGWRGAVARIAAEAIDALVAVGGQRDRALAAVFPGIGDCCYRVGQEVVGALHETFGSSADAWCSTRDGASFVDLRAAIAHTLSQCGVAAPSIDVVPGCTACDGRLYSHRASGGAPARSALFALLTDG